MTHSLAIEPPTSVDAAALIGELNAELLGIYHPDACHHLSAEQLAQPNTIFYVARVDGQAVGCGALRRMAGYAEIKRMYVRPAFRRQGIAAAILRQLEAAARAQAEAVLRLETGVASHAARTLYERGGYRPIQPFGEYSDNGVSLCYEKQLA